jgi:hypothetical protein
VWWCKLLWVAQENFPQGLKPASLLALSGTTEVVPFQNTGESALSGTTEVVPFQSAIASKRTIASKTHRAQKTIAPKTRLSRCFSFLGVLFGFGE